MEFTFSTEQDDLRVAVRAFLADRVVEGTVRAMLEDPVGITPAGWAALVDLGWSGLLVPVDQGGLGLGLVDAVVVLEEMGRVTFPGPYLSSAVLATLAACRLGATELLERLARGARGAVALEEAGSGDPLARVRTRARRRGARWVLTGVHPLVLDAAGAEWVLLPARTEEGLGSFLVEHPSAESVPVVDPTRSAARLVLDESPAIPVGPQGDHTEHWRRIVDDAAVALAAELVGVGDAALAMAVDYAKSRVQFDVPIASHQVIQHKIVDMLHRLELARVGVHYAAWASDTDAPGRAEAAAIAKSTMGEAAVLLTAENIQIHGAVGFTWDCDAQLLYKRAKQNDVLVGSGSWHRRRIAGAVLG